MSQSKSIKFNQQLANYIAGLARLDPAHPGMERIVTDMQRILAMVEVMDEIDTSAVEPLRHPLELPGLMRDDIPASSTDRDALLANAPATSDGLFLVPQVIE